MWKLSVIAVMVLSGCSHFQFNTSMCDQIGMEPNAVIPQECRNYNEDEAKKAFDKTKHKNQTIDEEVIKFQKESEEN